MEKKWQLFNSLFQSFQILRQGCKPDDCHRVPRRKFHLFPVYRLVFWLFRSSDAHLAFVWFLSVEILRGRWGRGDASWKLAPLWMMKDALVWKPDGHFYRFNLQLQKSQISLCRVQQWQKKATKVSRTLKLKTTVRPLNKRVKTPSQQSQQPATNRRTRKATRKVQQMQIKELSRLPSWDSSRRNDDCRETCTLPIIDVLNK